MELKKFFKLIALVFVLGFYISNPVFSYKSAQQEYTPTHQEHNDEHKQDYEEHSGHQEDSHAKHEEGHTSHEEIEGFDPGSFIFDHIADSYGWHIFTLNGKHISLPLPVILYSKNSGLVFFMSGKLHHGHSDVEAKGATFRLALEGDFE